MRRDLRLRADRAEEVAMAMGGKNLGRWIKDLREAVKRGKPRPQRSPTRNDEPR